MSSGRTCPLEKPLPLQWAPTLTWSRLSTTGGRGVSSTAGSQRLAFLCPPSRAGASSHWPGTGPALAVPRSATAAALVTSDRPSGEDSASSRPRPPALKAALVPVFWGLLPWHHLGEAARAGRRWGAEAGAGPHREGPREPQGVAAEGERGSQRHRGRGGTSLKSHQMEPGLSVGSWGAAPGEGTSRYWPAGPAPALTRPGPCGESGQQPVGLDGRRAEPRGSRETEEG